jgi:hypothetical protein
VGVGAWTDNEFGKINSGKFMRMQQQPLGELDSFTLHERMKLNGHEQAEETGCCMRGTASYQAA